MRSWRGEGKAILELILKEIDPPKSTPLSRLVVLALVPLPALAVLLRVWLGARL